MASRLSLLLLIGLAVPFTTKPVHVDDANFLAMAKAAAQDPWRPHDFLINRGGQTERAFDVLSNPPGIALWLAPVSDLSVFWMHLWMLPWLALAVWGAAGLGTRVAGKPGAAALLIGGAPISVLATSAFTPDLPLLGCALGGAHLLLDNKRSLPERWPGALLLGASCLFRYSGLALLPLAALWPWLQGDKRAAIKLGGIAALPMVLLCVHDIAAYESIHLWSMVSFQSTSNGVIDIGHKASASIAALGGAAALPLLAWSRPRPALIGLVLGGLSGLLAASLPDFGTPTMVAVLFGAAGGVTLAGSLRVTDDLDRFLLIWLGLGFIFLMGLRFSAARYWLPFFAPAILIPLRAAGPGLIKGSAAITLLLSVGIAADDLDMANTQLRAANIAKAAGSGKIAGHWGFQHHLLSAGWTDAEDDELIEPGSWVATSMIAWPQVPSNTCWHFSETLTLGDPNPGLRIHSLAGGSNIHGNWISAPSPVRVTAPWTLASDPIDTLTLQRTCP